MKVVEENDTPVDVVDTLVISIHALTSISPRARRTMQLYVIINARRLSSSPPPGQAASSRCRHLPPLPPPATASSRRFHLPPLPPLAANGPPPVDTLPASAARRRAPSRPAPRRPLARAAHRGQKG
ncbi:hypothetical protein GUJ93_ZPchr0008g13553 [Zizania palustris]|uniref:Uncharacterized protein n=1 Tax=Zizania palustris TaxID=103762 RepID=A0A8J5V540_ZIZPA|nr:hypothetical protein GUJ93_ZPchr0008g13553 [Zizania palustris]